MEEFNKCCICGQAVPEDDAYLLDGNVYCDHCYQMHTTTCEHCGEIILRTHAQHDTYITLCERCLDNHYAICDDCGRFVHNDDAHFDDIADYVQCENCYNRVQLFPIKPYNFKPVPIFYGPGSLFMGVELEMDLGGEIASHAEALMDIANTDTEKIYIKHDGSLDNGFEVVSHPMALKYHREHMPWQELFDKAIQLGYRSHQTETAGLHVHVSRGAFGRNPEDQEAAIARIVYFVELHWNELLKFSRRTLSSMNRWAARYGLINDTQSTYKKAKGYPCGRYVAVNLLNRDTVEFRLFRGTLRYETFFATLQLVDEICRQAASLTDTELEAMSWGEFVLKIDKNEKPELISYLKSKQLYVNELPTESEEM